MKTFLNTTLLFFISLCGYAQKPAAVIPAFTFYKLNKTAFVNKDLAADKLLFFVFFDSDCDHCQHAITEINKRHSELKKTALYLLTLDSKEKLNAFLDKYGKNLKNNSNVTILQDLNNEFIQKFGPRKYPSLFLYSPKMQLMQYEDDEKLLPEFFKKIKEYKK
jgi:peroxiredoxin